MIQSKPISQIEAELKAVIPYMWRVQSSRASGCTCVAYIDARDVMDVLDKAVGVGNWQDEYYAVGGVTFCKLGVKFDDEWVWKSDAGSVSDIEKDKGLASDCFKRAAVKHGIGRFLYSLDMVWLQTWKTVDYKGKEVFKPMHDVRNGQCPPKYLAKSADGKPSLLLNEYKLTEYIREVLKKDNRS
jgi:hypothetical protein